MQGAVIRSYKVGSIIYFEGDRGDSVYVLQSGAVQLIYNSLDGQEELCENVKRGAFFGVKSSLGRYAREETAQVLADSTVLIFNSTSFQNLCLKNVRLVLQTLKVFSSQLRRVHKQVREQLGELHSLENSIEFLRVGEYYYKHGDLEKARYILKKFMECYPSSTVYNRAIKLKQFIDSAQPYPTDMEPLSSSDLGQNTNSSTGGGANQTSHKNTGDSLGSIGDGDSANSEEGVSEIFYEGLNLISSDLESAIQKFEKIMQTKKLAGFAEASIVEKAHFELNKCYLKKNNFEKTIQLTSDFIRKYPGSAQAKKSLMTLAEAFDGQGDKSKAMALYTKVINLPPRDQDSSFANKKLQKLKEKS